MGNRFDLHKDQTIASPPLDMAMMRRYISYAKMIKPHITDEVIERFRDYYVKMRNASVEGGEASAISITARQLEALVRLAEARAKAHLREEITIEDAEAVINLTQKSLEQVGIDVATGQIQNVITQDGPVLSWTQGTATISKVPTASSAVVALITDQWLNGRRLQGRYFIGPLNAEAIDETGQMLDSARADMEDSLYASITGLGGRLAVYHRPTRGQANGSYGDVVTVACRKRVGVLTSRRD